MTFNSFKIFLGIFLTQPFLAFAVDFYRVEEGPRPAPDVVAAMEYFYGHKLLWIGDAKPPLPNKINGIVWHYSQSEAKYFVGTENPTLISSERVQALEDQKWIEYQSLAPLMVDMWPKTELVSNILPKTAVDRNNPKSIQDYFEQVGVLFKQRYPNGYFVKIVDDFGTHGKVLSSNATIAKDAMEYFGGQYDETSASYSRKIFDLMLTNPEKIIIQEKIDAYMVPTGISGKLEPLEIRMHVVNGKVIPNLSYLRMIWTMDGKNPEIQKLIKSAENQLNEAFEKLNKTQFKDFYSAPYAFDVMMTKNGKIQIIESNVGGESGFLSPLHNILGAHRLGEFFTGEKSQFTKDYENVLKSKSNKELFEKALQLTRKPELRLQGADPTEQPQYPMPFVERAFQIVQGNQSGEELKYLLKIIMAFDMKDYLTLNQYQFILKTFNLDLKSIKDLFTSKFLGSCELLQGANLKPSREQQGK